MARINKIMSGTGIYHVLITGKIEDAFLRREDYAKFKDVLRKYRNKHGIRIFAYCIFMDHAHLLLRGTREMISAYIHDVLVSYAMYYNRKYERKGQVFKRQFRYEEVDTYKYYLAVLKYIHMDPVESYIVKKPEDYKYSSYNDYIQESDLIDKTQTFAIVDYNIFLRMHKTRYKKMKHNPIEVYDKRYTDEECFLFIWHRFGFKDPKEIALLEKRDRNYIICVLKYMNMSYRQIERVTGVSIGVIRKC